jgi:D-alanine-D-alanine ligase
MPTRVAVIYNDDASLLSGEARDAVAVQSVVACAHAVANALRERGLAVELHGALPEARHVIELVAALDVDLVFNLVEALGGDSRKEQAFAWLLELHGIGYTGSAPRAMALCMEKPVTRAVLASRGLPVPRGTVFERSDETLGDLRFPLIVKPSREDASHGIASEGVVRDEVSLRARVRYVIECYAQPALVEEFVEGREVNVGLLARGDGLEVLPLSEIDYSGFPAEMPHIVSYAGKWIEGSRDWDLTKVVAARDLTPAQRARIENVARSAFEVLQMNDYGRVDLRLDWRGEPFVIDVNPNPDISPDAGFALAAARAGLSYGEVVERIASSALRRHAAQRRAGSRS